MEAKGDGKSMAVHSTLDLGTFMKKFNEEMKNPALKDFSKTFNSLRDKENKGEKMTEAFKNKLVSDMKKVNSYCKLSEGFRQLLEEIDQKTVTKEYVLGKSDRKGSSPVPSSPKKNSAENKGIDTGNAPTPTPSSASPSPARKETAETEKLKNEIKKLKADLEAESKQVVDKRHLSEDRLRQIKELEKEKDNKIKELENEARCLSQRLPRELLRPESIEQVWEIMKNIKEERSDNRQNLLCNILNSVSRGKKLEEDNMRMSNAERDLKGKQDLLHKAEKDLKSQQDQIQCFEKQVNDYSSEVYCLQTKNKELESAYKKLEQTAAKQIEHLLYTQREDKRKFDEVYKKLLAERDDLRDRFSKLAGKKLQEQNADIADLSDPNRAMKLSEKFGQLYDDEWTNAFEYLTDKKGGLLQLRDAINVLLRLLQECWIFCNSMMETQMESLHNVFLHPDQNPANYVHQAKKVVDKPRIASKDTQTLKDLRRRIGVSPSVLEEVKQTLLVASKSWEKEKKGFDKKHIDACAPYLQKCAEICWLMALHDPPLFMKMEVKQGEKLDLNIYTVYSASGTTIDFLVWPPLYNGKDGGLLSKGVAEPLRVVSKKK